MGNEFYLKKSKFKFYRIQIFLLREETDKLKISMTIIKMKVNIITKIFRSRQAEVYANL